MADLAASEVLVVLLADDHPFVVVLLGVGPFADGLLEADLPSEQVDQPEGVRPSADQLVDGEIPSELAVVAFDWAAQRPEQAAHRYESVVGLVPFEPELVEPSDELAAELVAPSEPEPVAPSEGAVLSSEVAVLPSEDVDQPSGGAAQPSGGAAQPSGGADQPSGGADQPSGGVDQPSGGAQPSGGVPQLHHKACLQHED